MLIDTEVLCLQEAQTDNTLRTLRVVVSTVVTNDTHMLMNKMNLFQLVLRSHRCCKSVLSQDIGDGLTHEP